MERFYIPYKLMIVEEEGYSYVGELMSFKTPENTVMVRRVPGHPGTLEEMPITKLRVCTFKPTHVHYAEVDGKVGFPLDMLRYEMAAPVNFRIIHENQHYSTEIDPSFGFEKLVIATCTERKHGTVWTEKRWESFLWRVKPLRTVKIGE